MKGKKTQHRNENTSINFNLIPNLDNMQCPNKMSYSKFTYNLLLITYNFRLSTFDFQLST